jgi:hypothetical protein
MTAQNFTALFGGFAQLIIMLSGVCLIVGGVSPVVRRFALRLFFLGIFVAVVGSIGYQWLPPSLRIGE